MEETDVYLGSRIKGVEDRIPLFSSGSTRLLHGSFQEVTFDRCYLDRGREKKEKKKEKNEEEEEEGRRNDIELHRTR